MPRRPRHLTPLEFTLRADTARRVTLCAQRLGPPGAPTQLILQTGMLRMEIPPEEAARLTDWLATWWPPAS